MAAIIKLYQSLAIAKADPNIHSYARPELARLIPSVIVPEFNMLLNPASKFFRHLVKLVSIEPFEFDPRLFPEGASFRGVAGTS